MFWYIVKSIGDGIRSTPLPEFQINHPTIVTTTEKKDIVPDKNVKNTKETTEKPKDTEDFLGHHIGTQEEFQRAKRELEEEIKRLQGDF